MFIRFLVLNNYVLNNALTYANTIKGIVYKIETVLNLLLFYRHNTCTMNQNKGIYTMFQKIDGILLTFAISCNVKLKSQ